jgi:hypothetical protein
MFGFIGAVYATLVACYTANPIAAWLLRRSGIPVAVAPYVKQTLSLLLCAGLFWQLQPTDAFLKLGVVALFVALNVVLQTVTRDDITLAMPGSLTRRLRLAKESVPTGDSRRV